MAGCEGAGRVAERIVVSRSSGQAQVTEGGRAGNQVLGLGAAQRALVGCHDDASGRVCARGNHVVVAVTQGERWRSGEARAGLEASRRGVENQLGRICVSQSETRR